MHKAILLTVLFLGLGVPNFMVPLNWVVVGAIVAESYGLAARREGTRATVGARPVPRPTPSMGGRAGWQERAAGLEGR